MCSESLQKLLLLTGISPLSASPHPFFLRLQWRSWMGKCSAALFQVWAASCFPTTGRHKQRAPLNAGDLARGSSHYLLLFLLTVALCQALIKTLQCVRELTLCCAYLLQKQPRHTHLLSRNTRTALTLPVPRGLQALHGFTSTIL